MIVCCVLHDPKVVFINKTNLGEAPLSSFSFETYVNANDWLSSDQVVSRSSIFEQIEIDIDQLVERNIPAVFWLVSRILFGVTDLTGIVVP